MSIELGKFNQLEVVKQVDFGMYLRRGRNPVAHPLCTRRL